MLPSGASGGGAATVDVGAVTAEVAATIVDGDNVVRTRALSDTLRGFERPRDPTAEGSRLHFRVLLLPPPRLPLRESPLLPLTLLAEELLLPELLCRM